MALDRSNPFALLGGEGGIRELIDEAGGPVSQGGQTFKQGGRGFDAFAALSQPQQIAQRARQLAAGQEFRSQQEAPVASDPVTIGPQQRQRRGLNTSGGVRLEEQFARRFTQQQNPFENVGGGGFLSAFSDQERNEEGAFDFGSFTRQQRQIARGLAFDQFVRPELSGQQTDAVAAVRKNRVARGLRGAAAEAAATDTQTRFEQGNRRAALDFIQTDLGTNREGGQRTTVGPQADATDLGGVLAQSEAFQLLSRGEGGQSEFDQQLNAFRDSFNTNQGLGGDSRIGGRDSTSVFADFFGIDRGQLSRSFTNLGEAPSIGLTGSAAGNRSAGNRGGPSTEADFISDFGRNPGVLGFNDVGQILNVAGDRERAISSGRGFSEIAPTSSKVGVDQAAVEAGLAPSSTPRFTDLSTDFLSQQQGELRQLRDQLFSPFQF